MAVNERLLKLLACPECHASVQLVKEFWLVCDQCNRKYPIINEIPTMLIDEGAKYIDTPVEELSNPNT